MARTVVGRIARSLARAPIGLFDAGYGSLFGHRLLMLEHTGRKSGLPRRVVLEVVRQRTDDRYLVPAGMGKTADWYRNVQKQPRVRVWISHHKGVPAVARLMDQSEARQHFEAYRAQRRWTWRLLRPVIARLIGRSGQSDEDLFKAVPLVELQLGVRE